MSAQCPTMYNECLSFNRDRPAATVGGVAAARGWTRHGQACHADGLLRLCSGYWCGMCCWALAADCTKSYVVTVWNV